MNTWQLVVFLLFVGVTGGLIGYLFGKSLGDSRVTSEWAEMVAREKLRERQRLEIKEALQQRNVIVKETP